MENTIETTSDDENKCMGIEKKRFTLLLTIPGSYFIVTSHINVPFDSIIIFIIAVIIYYNYPILVTYNSTKPLYYEDLFIDRNKMPSLDIDTETKLTFKKFFTRFLIFTNALLTTGLYNYWIFKTNGSNSFYEIIGITGGILKIFQMINHYSAVSALYFIKKTIRNKIYMKEDSNEITHPL